MLSPNSRKEIKMEFFDATQVEPQQGLSKHPAGMFDFLISSTYGKTTKAGDGGMLVVEFTSPAGRIENRYNLFNNSAQAVDIAQKQLSALCHAVGVFKLSFPKNPDGSPNLPMMAAELRNARGRMEVGPQQNNAEYMEVKRVFDVNGNEPGKSGNAAPQPQQQPQQQAPMTQNGQGGWGGQPQQQNPAPQQNTAPPPNNNAGGGWGGNAAPANNGGNAKPPWG
jgi:hypothetical protein